jgi:Glycosyltransferase family 87
MRSTRLVVLTVGFALAHGVLLVFSLIAINNPKLTSGQSIHVIASDASRYHQIADQPGVPYRDFQVEYPPITLVGIKLLNGSSLGETAKQVGVFCLFLSFGVASMLLLGWGARECATYLGLSLPLSLFVYLRLDLVSVILALAAFMLLLRDRQEWAGITLAFAVFAKVWPVVLLPLFVVRRSWKGLGWFLGLAGAALLAWVLIGGLDAPAQVATFRHARGWQEESLVGAVLWTLGGRTYYQAGAVRVGSVPTWAEILLLLVGAGIVVLAWALRNRRVDGASFDATAMVASVGAVLLISPILSPQYMVWLLPWVALVTKDRLLVGSTLVAVLLTTLMWFLPFRTPLFQAELLGRNAVLILLVGQALWRLRPPDHAIQEPPLRMQESRA